jgi:small subunit ribosomal protein S24e
MDGNLMKVKITAQQHNPLLKRKEVTFEAAHELHEGTPTRIELRKNLADILKANIDLVFIERAITKTGSMLTVGEAHVYDTPEQAKMVEAEHIITRNIPAVKPKEGEEATPPKEEAPKPKEETIKPKEEGTEKKPEEA